ncbi:MAG: hypothetical protein GY795_49210 [Desulfobacterales bacterium]|nr:hypothetical protein [Desulfobacterales bacterium]
MEKKIPIQNMGIFFSVLIATLGLRKIQSKTDKIKISYIDYHAEFKYEIQLISQRFPELTDVFNRTEFQIRKELLFVTFEKLKTLFEKADDDVDDIISWSYQFLKKDSEKTAFKKTGKNKTKIRDSDILFVTQFFTDRYMVKYLVDKSLSGFDENNIANIVIIDPASGGGNFLNYSFEQIVKIYEKANPTWTSQMIVETVLNKTIIGYDLDSSLSKIASLSLFVKACSYAIPSIKTQINVYGGIANDKLGFLNPDVDSNSICGKNFKLHLENIKKEKIKVFLTNPPFMGKRDMDTALKNYLLSNYPESKGDLCAAFIQRIIQIMNQDDILGVVSQNNWMYLSSFKEFRKLFLEKKTLKECIDLGSNAFEDINGEKTNVVLCIISSSKIQTSIFHNLKFKTPCEKRSFVTYNNIPPELTFESDQSQFLKNRKFEFNFQLGRFENIKGLQLYSEFANPMQGTSTGNNSEFVKYVWEVNGSPDWKLVSKGGGFSKWAGLNYYKVHWGKNAEIIKANKGSALRNIDKISATQLVYSDTGTLGLNVRVLRDNQVFIASGPGIQVLKGNKYAHLAFLNSRIATFLLKLINPKFTVSAGYISKLPVANILYSDFIAEKSKTCLKLKEKYLQNKLPNIEFQHQDYLNIKNIDSFIEKLLIEDIENDYQRLLSESEIELEITEQYCFKPEELLELKRVVGESPFFNKNTSINISAEKLDFLLSSSIDANCLATGKSLEGYPIGSESVLEVLSYKLNINPKAIFHVIKNNVSLLKNTKTKYFKDLLHKIILKELNIIHIYRYNPEHVNACLLLKGIKSKYTFLKHHPELTQEFHSILNIHHKVSFFNKPLISISNESITVGQVRNE